MRQQREPGFGRQRRTAPQTQQPSPGSSDAERAEPGNELPLDQAPTARYAAPETLPPLDEPITQAPTQAVRMPTSKPGQRGSAASDDAQPTRALAPLKPDAERDRAVATLNASRESSTTLIPGAKRYRPPAKSVVPRRSGPRSVVTQFAVSMVVTALLIGALTLTTPLGQAAALDVSGPLQTYAGAAPWSPTPTPKPKSTTAFRPPAGANPGQQAIINEIVSIFGPYAQGALNVSKCESGYDPNAWNSYPILNSHASGVFQILYPSTWNTTSYASSSPFNADANIHAAYQIFKRDGYSWREWQCRP